MLTVYLTIINNANMLTPSYFILKLRPANLILVWMILSHTLTLYVYVHAHVYVYVCFFTNVHVGRYNDLL